MKFSPAKNELVGGFLAHMEKYPYLCTGFKNIVHFGEIFIATN